MCVYINGIWFIFVYIPLSLPPRLVAFCMLLNIISIFIPPFYASCEITMSFVPSLLSLLFRVLMLTNTRHRVWISVYKCTYGHFCIQAKRTASCTSQASSHWEDFPSYSFSKVSQKGTVMPQLSTLGAGACLLYRIIFNYARVLTYVTWPKGTPQKP